MSEEEHTRRLRRRRYRPRRLLAAPPGRRPLRRMLALLLCVQLLMALLPARVSAAGGYDVSFVNYDLSSFAGEGHQYQNVPEGTRLYKKETLEAEGVSVPEGVGSTWYLYYEGGGDSEAFGPYAIPDPPERQGHTFQDWAAQGASDNTLYTVTGNTTFVARYVSNSQYVVNLYYQYRNDSNTVAAETATVPYSWNGAIQIQLPHSQAGSSLAGLTARIVTSSADRDVQDAVARLDQMIGADGFFRGQMDDTFLGLCRTAGYVAWDDAAGDYQRDENGNVQISIPVTYTVMGDVQFKVEYQQQSTEDPETYITVKTVGKSVAGTTRVSLNQMGLVEQYEGFALTAASAVDANSYTVNVNGTSTIVLRYDRKVYHIYYRMEGGNVINPLPLRFGQAIPAAATDGGQAIRLGYTFLDWACKGEQDKVIPVPQTMPAHDLILEAKWQPSPNATQVTLVYWLENANDGNYSVAGQTVIPATAGQTVGYDVGGDAVSPVDIAINSYVDPAAAGYSAEIGVGREISDIAYFTFSQADSSNQYAVGAMGGPKVIEGDGSTVINIGYTRNEYTLVFHLGKISDGSVGGENVGWYYISTGGNSSAETDPGDWKSGYSGWRAGGKSASLSMDGKTYWISENDADCYQITAKYGAYISDRWPVSTQNTTTQVGNYRLFTWGTHASSPYFQTRKQLAAQGQRVNYNIIGVYATMSSELIIDPKNPGTAHHLTAYWNSSNNKKTHYYLFEVAPGVDPPAGAERYTFSQFTDGTYSQVNDKGAGEDLDPDTEFYCFRETEVYTSADSDRQNAPDFSGLTYQNGYYKTGTNAPGSGDVFFLYTYTGYTLTYHENNANQLVGTEAKTKTVPFHYIEGVPVAEQIGGMAAANYTPAPYVSSYGNEYTFLGWYTSNLAADTAEYERFRIDWDTFAPSSSVGIYAAWKAPTFTLTLIVPDGTLYQDSLDQFQNLGYTWTQSSVTDPVSGKITNTYRVSGIPGYIRSSQIVTERKGARNSRGLAFDYWSYIAADGSKQQYLFDDSQLMTGDLVLTAQWKTEYTGQYTVRYLTRENPGLDLGVVESGGSDYFRVLQDKTVAGVVVGSSVTEEALPVNGYLSQRGSITKMVRAAGAGGESGTVFDFIYEQISGEVVYQVHYVWDTGMDYGRGSPPDDVQRLAEDKTVTVHSASLRASTTVSETAPVIGGYTPRDRWNHSLTLSSSPEQNHLYIYYVSNTYEVDFRAVYHFAQPDGSYTQGDTFRLESKDALGKVIYARDLVEHYRQYLAGDAEGLAELEEKMRGRVLDAVMTSTPYILLTQPGQTDNTIHIYLQNRSSTLTYDLNDDDTFRARWPDADHFLTGAEGAFVQTVTYPAAADVPQTAPQRLAYRFTGWNTRPDGGGTGYTADTLATAPWYQPGGMYEDVTLYAQWEAKLAVSFDLRQGEWTDSGGGFHRQPDGLWRAYVALGQTAPQPENPTLVTGDGIAYSFVGWTAENPDNWDFTAEGDRIDMAAFEPYRYRFDQPLAESVTLYAVWDRDVHTFHIYKTDADQTDPSPLAGASFTLERLLADVTANASGGYDYTLRTDETGAYLPDGSFAGRTLTSDAAGKLAFHNLPAGYYRLTETAAPEGYTGLSGPVILYAAYGGGGRIENEEDWSGQVRGEVVDGDLTVTVRNVSQYSLTIDAPASITFAYAAPDFIWNPETQRYEGQTEGVWQMTALPAGQPGQISVTNTSQGQNGLNVEVTLAYQEGYAFLLPLSALHDNGANYTPAETALSKTLTGTLAAESVATFSLTLEGTVPPDAAMPPEETQVGVVSVRITKAND